MNIYTPLWSATMVLLTSFAIWAQEDSLEESDSIQTLETMTVIEQATESPVLKTSPDIGKLELDADNIKTLPAIGEADISRALQLMPGISGTNESSAELIIHGGAPEQNLTLLDGIPLYYVDHFFGFYSPFNPDAIENVEVFKSYFPSRYGSRTSSVQAYTGKKADFEKLGIGATVSLLSASAYAEIPFAGRVSLFISGRRSYSDVLRSPLFEKIFGQFDEEAKMQKTFNTYEIYREPHFNYFDINAKIHAAITDNDTASAALYYGKDFLETNATGDKSEIIDSASQIIKIIHGNIDNDCYWGNWGMSAQWFRHWSSRFKSNLNMGYTNYFLEHQEDFSADFKTFIKPVDSTIFYQRMLQNRNSDNNISEISMNVSTETTIGDWNRLHIGMGGKRINAVYAQNEAFKIMDIMNDTVSWHDSNKISNLDDEEDEAFGWVQDDISLLSQKFTLSPGIRLTYYTGKHDYYISPRILCNVSLTDYLSLKAAWGLYHQFLGRITTYDLYLEGDRYIWVLSTNQSCPVSQSNQTTVGLRMTLGGFIFDVEGYYHKMSDLSSYKLSYSPTVNSFITGKGTAAGIDFLIQKTTGMFTGWVCYTLGKSVYQFSHEINNGNPFYSPFDHTHELKCVTKFTINNFNISLVWLYSTGNPYTKPIGSSSIELTNGTIKKYTVWSYQNAYRLPDYHRLDISTSYKIKVGSFGDMFLGASLFNTYNRHNIKSRDYRFVFNNDGKTVNDALIYPVDTKYMGISPSVFVSIHLKQK